MDNDMICIGCGAILQTENPKLEGYVPPSSLNKDREDLYCQRCFKMRHYNELVEVALDEDSFLEILNEISERQALVVHVVDMFDIQGSILSSIHRFSGHQPLLVVGNKVDLFPQSVKRDRLRHRLEGYLREEGLRPDNVLVLSAKQEDHIKHLVQTIEDMRKGRDVYFVGAANVGKSTLMNRILGLVADENQVITTSYFPGTTLGKIEIPLEDGQFLVDTPGLIQKNSLTYYLEPRDQGLVMPKKRLKPKTYQLALGQSLLLGGVGRLDIKDAENEATAVVYVSDRVTLHRTKTEKATDMQDKHTGSQLMPPSHRDKDLPPLVKKTIETKEKSDLAIHGLGWITLPAGLKVDVYAPKGVSITLRSALI